VGKTRLALAVADDAIQTFEDGVAFVPLASVRAPWLIAPAVAHALGAEAAGDEPWDELLVASLRDRDFLLVLDNFEQVTDGGPFVTDLLAACPRLTVLVTSRARLHLPGEHDVPVAPLAVPDRAATEVADYPAVRLFVERAQASYPAFPLAIELAAARTRLLSPTAHLARMTSRLRILAGGPRDAPDRLRTMRAAVAWSYDLLPCEERSLFRRLGVFVGGCSLEAAEAVGAAGDPGIDVLEGLTGLVDQSLVQRIEGARARRGSPCWRRSVSTLWSSSGRATRSRGSGRARRLVPHPRRGGGARAERAGPDALGQAAGGGHRQHPGRSCLAPPAR
jgi:predicted ATPase